MGKNSINWRFLNNWKNKDVKKQRNRITKNRERKNKEKRKASSKYLIKDRRHVGW